MKARKLNSILALSVAFAMALPGAGFMAAAQEKTPVPKEVTTPDKVESRAGSLTFKDGFPTGDTATKLRDELDYLHGVEAFMNSIQAVSVNAIRKGFHDIGVKDNDVFIFSKLMNSQSLFLTANADTVYFWSVFDLSDGPLVLETPSDTLGIIDDMWFRWVTDFGLPGADKGEGGKYLLVPPGYTGELPEGGYYVRHARTNHLLMLARAFIDKNEGNDPAPSVARIKEQLKLYPYVPGGVGTSVGSYLQGKGSLGKSAEAKSPRFVEGSGLAMNTVPPNDFNHYLMLNEVVQMEPAEALDSEIAGQFAAIGIVKGQEFKPDERLRKILDEAVATGNAASRTLAMGEYPSGGFRYYGDDSAWWNPLFFSGYDFMGPIPEITAEGAVKPFPATGALRLHERASMFYVATGITPAMSMRLTNIGSQYLIANVDKNGEPFDGAKTYKVTLPKDIPAGRFWSFTLYDNETRSMLQTPQLYPRAGSQKYPSPAAEPAEDGSTTVWFSPQKPEGVADGNWIQTDPEKGWFNMLRIYSPLEPFFDKSWRVSEIEQAN